MKGRVELKVWEKQKMYPLREHHFKVLSGQVLVYSPGFYILLPAGKGLRIAWPYTMIAYEKSVVEYL